MAAEDELLVDVVRDDERALATRLGQHLTQRLCLEHPAQERDIIPGEAVLVAVNRSGRVDWAMSTASMAQTCPVIRGAASWPVI